MYGNMFVNGYRLLLSSWTDRLEYCWSLWALGHAGFEVQGWQRLCNKPLALVWACRGKNGNNCVGKAARVCTDVVRLRIHVHTGILILHTHFGAH